MLNSLLTLLGIVLPSLAIWWVINRTVARVDWRIFLLFLTIAIGFVAPGIVPGRITVDVDEVARGYPFRPMFDDVTVRNPLTNDTTKLFLPWMQTVREEFALGNLPLWNRYSFAGYPLLANGESAPFSPFFLFTLFVPLPKQIVAMAGLKLFAGFLFTYLSARRLGASTPGSLFAAFAFTLATSNVVYLYYSAAATSLLLPMLYFACSSLVAVRSRSNIALTAVAIWSLLASGHPETAFHAALATAALVIVELAVQRRGWRESVRAVIFLALVVFLGAVASAINWVPVIEQIPRSIRFSEIKAASKEMSAPMPGMSAWTLLHPDAFGTPSRGNWSWVMNYSVVASSYAGLLTLALLGAALLDRRSGFLQRVLALTSVVFFFVAMNWTIVGNLVNSVPPISYSASDKFRFAAAFAAALAVALRVSQVQRTFIVDQLAVVAVSLGALYLNFDKPDLVHPLLAPVALLTIVTVIVVRASVSPIRAASIVAAAVLVDLFVFGSGFNVATEERYFRPKLPVVAALGAVAPSEPFRVVGFDWVLFPNTSAHYGLEDIRGSDPMGLASYDRFVRMIAAKDSSGDIPRIQDVEQQGLDFLNVRYLIAEPSRNLESKRWKRLYVGRDASLYENRGVIPRFFVPHRIVKEDVLSAQLSRIHDLHTDVIVRGRESANVAAPRSLWIDQARAGRFRLTLEAPTPTFVASSQPFTPDWRVEINGQRVPVSLVNGTFLGFDAPAGRSRIVVHYFPRSVTLSIVAMFVAVAVLVIVAAGVRKAGLESG